MQNGYLVHIIPAAPGLHLAWALALSPSSTYSTVKSAVDKADLALQAAKARAGGSSWEILITLEVYIPTGYLPR